LKELSRKFSVSLCICSNASMPFKPPQAEKCAVCQKPVYAAERLEAGGNIYHKMCFKCSVCKNSLKLNTYSQADGILYCKTDYQKSILAKNAQISMWLNDRVPAWSIDWLIVCLSLSEFDCWSLWDYFNMSPLRLFFRCVFFDNLAET
jgi:cysteine/glycine-rich protein